MSDEQVNADHLADRLDRHLPPDGHDPASSGDTAMTGDPLLDAATRLANAPRLEMPPDVTARIQALVLDTNRQHQRARVRSYSRITSITRWAAAASVLLVFMFAALTPAMASSVPGDALYPFKVVAEQVELALATSYESQANVYMVHAERRVEEALVLVERGQFDATLANSALDEMIRSANAARHTTLTLTDLQTRTVQVNADLDRVLRVAAVEQLASEETLAVMAATLEAARDNGSLLLPAPVQTVAPVAPTDTPTPTDTATPTATDTPTSTPTDTPTDTPMDAPTSTPTDTPRVPSDVVFATNTPSPTATPTDTGTPTPTDTPTPTPSITAVITSKSPVNVRKGPGLNFPVIHVLQPGESVHVLGWTEDGVWLHILLDDGRDGWIATGLSNLKDTVKRGQGVPLPTEDCDHPGNYCNAPGQQNNPDKGKPNDPPGQNNGRGQGGSKTNS